jgi:hypothetical protein
LRAVDAILGDLAVAGQAEVVEALHLGSHCGCDGVMVVVVVGVVVLVLMWVWMSGSWRQEGRRRLIKMAQVGVMRWLRVGERKDRVEQREDEPHIPKSRSGTSRLTTASILAS